MALCALMHPNPRTTVPAKRKAVDLGSGQKRQIFSLKRRKKVAMDNTEAATILGIKINIAGAVADRCANVVRYLMT